MKWEYVATLTVPGDDNWGGILTDMGERGWEAWHMSNGIKGREIYFKRAKHERHPEDAAAKGSS
jgi:hypothetical protein